MNIAIIGGGPGGYSAAIKAAQLGGSVTLIEKDHLGGTCLNWGCIPSKILKHAADSLALVQKAGDFGIQTGERPSLDIQALMQHKEKVLNTQRSGIEALLGKNGIRVVQGTAVISSSNSLAVTTANNEQSSIVYNRLIIAAGTRPQEIFPADHAAILNSNDLLCLDSVPESIIIVGGGVIGCEFACILAAFGAEVTLVEAMPRILPLPGIDASVSKLLQREMKKQGIRILTGKTAEGLTVSPVGVRLELAAEANGTPAVLEAQKAALCTGRTPLSADLGLEAAGVAAGPQGWISVNEAMETSVPGIYAIGDILGPEKIMLAHAATREGLVAAANAMGGNEIMRYDAIPSAVFTTPETASVGMTAASAADAGIAATTVQVNYRSLGKAHATGDIAGEAVLIVENGTETILGAHITGARASDLIAEAALAITAGLTIHNLTDTIHAHPTFAEILYEAGMKAAGTPLHG